MNIHIFNGLLLAAGAALAGTSACTDQLELYNNCLAAVDPNILNSRSLFDVNKACEILNGDNCIDFVKDAYIPSTNCSLKDDNEKDSAISIINLKIAYLKYCVTDAEGVICPLSEHLLESFSTSDTTTNNTTTTTTEKDAKENTEKKEEDDGTFVVGEYNYLKTHAQEREFNDWNGKWKSFYPIITSGSLDDVFASLGDQGEMYKQTYTKGFKSDIVNLVFDKKDNTITFKYDNGKEVKAEYKYSSYDILEWEENVYGVFYKFERVDKKSKAPKYLRICDEYLKTVEKNNVMFTWISDKSFEDAYDTKHWIGFAREEVSNKEIADVFLEEIGEEGAEKEDASKEDTKETTTTEKDTKENTEKKEEDDGTFVVGEYNYLKTHAQEREFNDWNGKWKSFYPIITSGSLDDVFASLGDQGEMYKQTYTEGFKSDIVNLVFDKKDNTITFKYDNGKEIKAEYKYSSYDILEWEENVYGVFYKFERVDKKSKAPKYLRICDEYLKTVEKNNVMFTWISDKSFEDAYDTKHWIGFAREEVSNKEIADVFLEEIGEEGAEKEDASKEDTKETTTTTEKDTKENTEKKEEDDGTFVVGEYNYLKTHAQEREFNDWNGKWKSFYPIITSGSLDDVFASLGDQGEMYKQTYTEGFKSDIVNLVFDKKDNTITFKYDNGKEVKAEYKYSSYDILEWEENVYGVFYKFERVDKKSKAPKYLRICDEYLKTVERNNVMFTWISDKSFEDAYDTKHWIGFAREEVSNKEIADVFLEEISEGTEKEDASKEDTKETTTTTTVKDAKENTEKKEEDDGTFVVGEYNYLKTHAQEREFNDWNGKWKSFYPIITSGSLDDVFASLGDQGEMYKQTYTEGFKSDIVNLVFDKKDNTITFKYDNGKEVKAEYKYSSYDILEWEENVYGVFYKFERVDKKSKAPKYLRICDEYLKTVEKNNVMFTWISDKSFEDAYDTKHWIGFAREEVSNKEIADVFLEEISEGAEKENTTKETTTDSIENSEDEEVKGEPIAKDVPAENSEEEVKGEPIAKDVPAENSEEEVKGEPIAKDVPAENSEEEVKGEPIAKDVPADNSEAESKNYSEEESEDDSLVNEKYLDMDSKEKEDILYEELINDCNIEECNRRFLALVSLMKLTDPDSDETKTLVSAAEYYKSKNCKGLQSLASEYTTSGVNSFMRRMSFTFVIMTIFTIVLLI